MNETMSGIILQFIIIPLLLSVPVAIGGILHMLVVKRNLLPNLKIPINQRLFGINKTWRGVLVVPLTTIIGTLVAGALAAAIPTVAHLMIFANPLYLGYMLGIGYVLAELPNSWMKRSFGIKEGCLPEQGRTFFFIFDQLDSVLGCALVYFLLTPVLLSSLLMAIVLSVFVHLAINYALFLLKVRHRPC